MAPAGRSEPLILASASPRRQQLLREAGIEFRVLLAEEPEPEMRPGEDCRHFARRAAEAKATAVATRYPARLVLGADTIVVLDGEALGKPLDEQQAREMLTRLSGRAHHVYTGVVLAQADGDGQVQVTGAVVSTAVTFRPLTQAVINDYVRTGEPLDKAGSYGIQGLGARLVAGYDGSYTNVVGLPMETVRALLKTRQTP